MNGLYNRTREALVRARGATREVTRWRGRTRVVVAVAGAVVLAAGVGIAWGFTSDGDQRSNPASLGELAGGGPDGLASPGSLGADGSTPGGGPSGSTDSGAGSGSSGGGAAGNRPPVIDDPGLSSDSLSLTIAPTVTDPDGDPLSLSYQVDFDGKPVASETGSTANIRLDHTDVGYAPTVSVSIRATDGRGGVTEETFTHDLEAISHVTVREIQFVVRETCFDDTDAFVVTGAFSLTGVVATTFNFEETVRADGRPFRTVFLLPRPGLLRYVHGVEAVQSVELVDGSRVERDGATVADGGFRRTHRESEGTPAIERVYVLQEGDCEVYFTYRVDFTVITDQ